MRGQAILTDRQPRPDTLDLPRALDREGHKGEHVRPSDLRRALDLRMLGVEKRPQLLQRVVLVPRGRVHVTDALLVGLQVQAVDLAEALGDLRAGDQLARGQTAGAQPALRSPSRAALQHAGVAEHRVQGIHPATDAIGHSAQVGVGDLAGAGVAAVQHDPDTKQMTTATDLIASPLDGPDPLLQPDQLDVERIFSGQPCEPLRQPRPRQQLPTGTDHPADHQRCWTPRPTPGRSQAILPGLPGRPTRGLDRRPAILPRRAVGRVEQRKRRADRAAHIARPLTAQPPTRVKLAQAPLQRGPLVQLSGERQGAHRSLPPAAWSSSASVTAS